MSQIQPPQFIIPNLIIFSILVLLCIFFIFFILLNYYYFQHFIFVEIDMCFSQFSGMTFNSKKIGEGLNSKAKSAVMKGVSTLMKPTASQLAKQNRPLQFVGSR